MAPCLYEVPRGGECDGWRGQSESDGSVSSTVNRDGCRYTECVLQGCVHESGQDSTVYCNLKIDMAL